MKAYLMRASNDGVVYKGYVGELENSLKAEQDYAGDGIETFTLNDDFVLIGARDAVIWGKTLNRALYDERGKLRTVFAGNLMVVRYKEDVFESIREEDVELLETLLKPIEQIYDGAVFLKAAEELPEWKGEADEPIG